MNTTMEQPDTPLTVLCYVEDTLRSWRGLLEVEAGVGVVADPPPSDTSDRVAWTTRVVQLVLPGRQAVGLDVKLALEREEGIPAPRQLLLYQHSEELRDKDVVAVWCVRVPRGSPVCCKGRGACYEYAGRQEAFLAGCKPAGCLPLGPSAHKTSAADAHMRM